MVCDPGNGNGGLSIIIFFRTGRAFLNRSKTTTKEHQQYPVSSRVADGALILTCGHLGILLIDSYFPFKLSAILIPFASSYETLSMGMGTIAVYFLILTIVASKLHKKIGYQGWKGLHALNPILYILVTLHGLLSGSDFSGTLLAAINLAPLLTMAVLLLSNPGKIKPAKETYPGKSMAGARLASGAIRLGRARNTDIILQIDEEKKNEKVDFYPDRYINTGIWRLRGLFLQKEQS